MPRQRIWQLLAIPALLAIGGLISSIGSTRGLAVPRSSATPTTTSTSTSTNDPDGSTEVLKMLREVGDRSGYQVTSGPILMMPDPSSRVLYPVEAVYYLDYRGARLLAIIPTGSAPTPSPANIPAATTSDRISTTCVGRDLAADFAIPPGVEPRFLMTVARQGYGNGGWAPLFVIEASTNQAISYRVSAEMVGGASRSKFTILDRINLEKVATVPADR